MHTNNTVAVTVLAVKRCVFCLETNVDYQSECFYGYILSYQYLIYVYIENSHYSEAYSRNAAALA
jgi:hypothetical protein